MWLVFPGLLYSLFQSTEFVFPVQKIRVSSPQDSVFQFPGFVFPTHQDSCFQSSGFGFLVIRIRCSSPQDFCSHSPGFVFPRTQDLFCQSPGFVFPVFKIRFPVHRIRFSCPQEWVFQSAGFVFTVHRTRCSSSQDSCFQSSGFQSTVFPFPVTRIRVSTPNQMIPFFPSTGQTYAFLSRRQCSQNAGRLCCCRCWMPWLQQCYDRAFGFYAELRLWWSDDLSESQLRWSPRCSRRFRLSHLLICVVKVSEVVKLRGYVISTHASVK